MDGAHDILRCEAVTSETLSMLLAALAANCARASAASYPKARVPGGISA
jgi:fructose-bisphosphate aldolase class 1